MLIGLISDTHSYLDPKVFDHFADCDEIWHAGDIGDGAVLDALENFKPTRSVFGNIDGPEIRYRTRENLHFKAEGFNIWMTHIGGAPPRYNPYVRPLLQQNPPHIFICGHSHILRVMRDEKLRNMLYLNPGAAGIHGFHKIRTLLRFELTNGHIKNMQAIELGLRGAIQ